MFVEKERKKLEIIERQKEKIGALTSEWGLTHAQDPPYTHRPKAVRQVTILSGTGKAQGCGCYVDIFTVGNGGPVKQL